jgi:hypothetical protein
MTRNPRLRPIMRPEFTGLLFPVDTLLRAVEFESRVDGVVVEGVLDRMDDDEELVEFEEVEWITPSQGLFSMHSPTGTEECIELSGVVVEMGEDGTVEVGDDIIAFEIAVNVSVGRVSNVSKFGSAVRPNGSVMTDLR